MSLFPQYGDTPLHTAARYGHAGVTRILVSARGNVSEQNKVTSSLVWGLVSLLQLGVQRIAGCKSSNAVYHQW